MITQDQLKKAKKDADILLMAAIEVQNIFENEPELAAKYPGSNEFINSVINNIAYGVNSKEYNNLKKFLRG